MNKIIEAALNGVNKVTVNGREIDVQKLLEEAKILYWKENGQVVYINEKLSNDKMEKSLAV